MSKDLEKNIDNKEVEEVKVRYDESGLDEKIICVPSEKVDKTYVGVKDMDDLPKQTVDEFIHFFEHYKDLEVGKYVKILGTGNANDACKLIESYKISS